MLSLLVEPDEIAEAQEALLSVMSDEFPVPETRNITFRPLGPAEHEIWTRDGYWYLPGTLEGEHVATPRFLNRFGVMADGALSITVQANVALDGRQGSAEGFYARDDSTGALYLLHSGNVGGGTRGVGGRAFRAWYGRRREEVFDADGHVHFGFVVIPVGAWDPTRPTRHYVDVIETFRRKVREGEIDTNDPDFRRTMQEYDDFYREPRGRRRGYRPEKIDYLSRHGEVVDALHEWRKAQRLIRGQRIVKNVFIDMGVEDGPNNLVEVYEVKSSSERSDVYTALGQLMVHGSDDSEKYLVLPMGRELPNDLAGALERHQVELLRFGLNEQGAEIL